MKCINFFSLLLLFSILALSSCNKEPEKLEAEASKPVVLNSQNEVVKLGKIRTNPFDSKVIDRAEANLFGASYKRSENHTHLYVKFKPTSQEHMVKLLEWEEQNMIPLFDFPMTQEILEGGDSSIPDNSSKSIIVNKEHYANVPKAIALPNIPHEIISYNYINRSELLVMAEAFRITGNTDDIQSYVLQDSPIEPSTQSERIQRVIPQLDYDTPCPSGCRRVLTIDDTSVPVKHIWKCDCTPPPPPSQPKNPCGCPVPSDTKIPAGCVQVQNGIDIESVKEVTIMTKDKWFGADYTKTDSRGCWQLNKRYSRNMWTWVKFKNNKVSIRTWEHWAAFRYITNYAGRLRRPPYNNIHRFYREETVNNSSKTRRYWMASNTINSFYDYYDFATNEDVPTMNRQLICWIVRTDDFNSAPMLRYQPRELWNPMLDVIFPQNKNLLAGLRLISANLPDMTLTYKIRDRNLDGLRNTAFHEIGHSSHYSLVGESYWRPYRRHIILNDGWGDPGLDLDFPRFSSPELVALGEAIGTYAETFTSPGNREFRPFGFNFVPTGLLWDLQDDNNDRITSPNGSRTTIDRVQGFTPGIIFRNLNPNIRSIEDLRLRLLQNNLQGTGNNIDDFNNLFNVYDVFED